jgi:hypothetical protein
MAVIYGDHILSIRHFETARILILWREWHEPSFEPTIIHSSWIAVGCTIEKHE